MYKRTIFETSDEFFLALQTKQLPETVYLVFENDLNCVSLSNVGSSNYKFGLSSSISSIDIIVTALKLCGIRVHVT